MIAAIFICTAMTTGVRQSSANDGVVAGAVEGIYVKEHHRLYIDSQLVNCSRRMSKPIVVDNWIRYVEIHTGVRDVRCENLWALVKVQPKRGEINTKMVLIPKNMELQADDKVEISLGEQKVEKLTGPPLSTEPTIVRRVIEDYRLVTH